MLSGSELRTIVMGMNKKISMRYSKEKIGSAASFITVFATFLITRILGYAVDM